MKLINVEVEDVDMRDYPDFCDAFLSYAEHEDGTPLSDDELDDINENHPDVVYEYVERWIW